MTELEKIQYTKYFIDKLANGIDPTTDMPAPEGDIINKVRVSRCLFYVSGILGEICRNGGKINAPRTSKIAFSITPEQLQNYVYTKYPISMTDIINKLYALAANENMKKLPVTAVTNWLTDAGLLYIQELQGGKTSKRPTQMGMSFGITLEQRQGQYGEYTAVMYGAEAERFIIDNIYSIIEYYNKK